MDLFQSEIPVLGPLESRDILRGVCRHLVNLNYSPLTEFKLSSKRRVDVIGLNKLGQFIIVEIKSSVSDFRGDKKWREYWPFADEMYFAVANGFPIDLLPNDCGIIIADAYNAATLQPSPINRMNAVRRKSQTVRFAKTAAKRLHRLRDPSLR